MGIIPDTSAAPDDATRREDAERVIDIALPRAPRNKLRFLRGLLVLVAAGLSGGAWYYCVSLLDSGEHVIEATVLVFVPWSAAAFVALLRTRRRVHHLARQVEARGVQQALVELLPQIERGWLTSFLCRVARNLVTEGCYSTSIRLMPAERSPRLEPISVPFEPHRFGDPSLLRAWNAGESDVYSARDETAQAHGATKDRLSRTALRSFWIVGAACAIVAFVGVGPHDALLALCLWGSGMLCLVALLMIIPAKRFYVVPGGLAVRFSGWLRRRGELHVFDRRRSVLVTYSLTGRLWSTVIADNSRVETLSASDEITTQALRAWLSPLAPPTVDQLSDLR